MININDLSEERHEVELPYGMTKITTLVHDHTIIDIAQIAIEQKEKQFIIPQQ